jgi:DsbC/DsbD-like thiol-disulfide interchange protein
VLPLLVPTLLHNPTFMKKLFFLVPIFFFVSALSSQQQNPVSWQAQFKAVTATEGEIILTASIQKGWHIYSQRPTEAGPIPTSFTLSPSQNFKLIDKPTEEGSQEEFDKAFEAKIYSFNEKATLKQKIKLTGKPGFTVNIKVEYMSCNDMMCLPPKTSDLTVKVQ